MFVLDGQIVFLVFLECIVDANFVLCNVVNSISSVSLTVFLINICIRQYFQYSGVEVTNYETLFGNVFTTSWNYSKKYTVFLGFCHIWCLYAIEIYVFIRTKSRLNMFGNKLLHQSEGRRTYYETERLQVE